MKTKDLAALMVRGLEATEEDSELTPEQREELRNDLAEAEQHFREAAASPDKGFYSLNQAENMLQEVKEVLTEMGWHSDRGLLYRIEKTLKSIRNSR